MLKLENQGAQGKLQTGGFARELEMEWKWPSWQGRLGTKAQRREGSPKQDSNKTFVRSRPPPEGPHFSPRKGKCEQLLPCPALFVGLLSRGPSKTERF